MRERRKEIGPTKRTRRKPAGSAGGREATRTRLETERDALLARLRHLRGAPAADDTLPGGNESALDEGDAAQASEHRDMTFTTQERVASRAAALTAALERLDRGEYGVCTVCGEPIEPQRLRALPEAATCLACQTRRESRSGPEAA